jgi:hypothetical protein
MPVSGLYRLTVSLEPENDRANIWLEVVSKPQIVFEGKAQIELKAQHTR